MSWGGKAESLKFLSERGFPVPAFHVLSTDDFRAARAAGGWPAGLKERVESWWVSKGKPILAVRSSATKEDGAVASFAGLFETFLDVRDLPSIFESIEKCWASVDGERVKAYCERQAVSRDDLEMAVVLQEFIEPDFAGVLFTVNPLRGDDHEMLLEACRGRGERLVSGHVTPSRYRLAWFGKKALATVDEDTEQLHLDETMLDALRRWGRKIQAAKGKPQDIEFAVKEGRVFLLQSRDITRLQFAEDLGEWTTADFRDGGVSSGVVAPLMWSLYERIFAATMPKYLVKIGLVSPNVARSTKWYRVFYGRPYWNLRAIKDAQSPLPGYNEKNFDRDMSIPPTYEGDGEVTPMSIGGLVRALPVLFKLRAEYLHQKKRSEDLIASFANLQNWRAGLDLKSLSTSRFLVEYMRLLSIHEQVESEYFQTIFNASNAKLEFSADLKPAQKKDPSIEYVHLIADLGDLRATLPVRRLTEMAARHRGDPRVHSAVARLLTVPGPIPLKEADRLPPAFREELSKFVEEFGFHSERELDLSVPRWNEDLRFLLSTFRSLCEGRDLPSQELLDQQKKATYETAFAKFRAVSTRGWRSLIPGSWSSVEKRLRLVRDFLWLREELRDRSTQVYGWIREFALETADRYKLGSGVFILFHDEILRLLEGTLPIEDVHRLIDERSQYADGYRAYKNPNELGAAFSRRGPKRAPRAQGADLFGIGCSAGRLRGKARVLKTLAESSRLQRGEILIAPFTDPGWTPLFSLASAVVTETGGLLSHAALISREYGIPSVLNVADATELIMDGRDIEIDGTEGRVTLL